MVLLSIFNGFTIALLSMLGEYVVRTLNAVSAAGELPRGRTGAGVTPAPAVIGAQRCGTTYLHDLLAAHPQIAMARPARPEPKVFLLRRARRPGVGSGTSDTYFAHATDETLLGEKSTSYLEYPEAADRAADGAR